MTEFDSRFGNPRHTDDPARESSHAAEEVIREWTSGLTRSMNLGFQPLFDASEQISDRCTALFGRDVDTFKHSQEILLSADNASKRGDDEEVKHYLKRDLAFSMWTLGFDNAQTKTIMSKLSSLEDGSAHQSEQAKAMGEINSFDDIFKRH